MNIRNPEYYLDMVPFMAIAKMEPERREASRPAFRPLVYICAPFSGDVESNKERATAFAEYAYRNGCIPLTPHLLFPFMNDESKEERKLALHIDMVLMGKCQEVWVLSDNITEGMKREIEKAEKRKQTIRYFDSDFMEVEQA